MRISTAFNASPESSPLASKINREQYIWGELALRLIHPLRLAIIETLYQRDRAMTVGDFAAAVDAREDLVRYHCKILVREGVLEVVEVKPQRDKGGDEALFDFPLPAEGSPHPPATAPA